MVIFLLLFPLFAFAGEFQASLSQNPVAFGEGVTLNLVLSEANAKATPSWEILKGDFSIVGQGQEQSTTVINGKASKSIAWRLTLMPQKTGDLLIPSISILTEEGILQTEPITVHVGGSAKNEETLLSAHISKETPYKNETLLYMLRLTSPYELANLALDKIAIQDAIITPAEKATLKKEIVNGVKMNVIELSYFITPLKAGPLEIPSFTLQGAIPSQGGRFFDLFSHYKPFFKQTDPILLEVKAPQMTPWLPAEKITIKDSWSSSPLQIHEPIMRELEIYSEGILSSQLPHLEMDHEAFKIYADPPQLKEEILNGKLISTKKQQFTLIPQKAGEITLPAISIAWWDLTKDQKSIAELPERPLQITSEPVFDPPAVEKEPKSYLISALILLLLLAIGWALFLQFKMKRLKQEKKPKFKDLNPT